jgi:hypothetical protein
VIKTSDDIAKQLEEIGERLDKIETFFAHDGFSMMLNEKLASNFGHMTKILVERIDKLEKDLLRKDRK